MESNCSPIVRATTKKTFFDYIDSLDIPQIDYFAIGIQNIFTKKSISLMSRQEWQEKFINNQYAEYDPVRRVTWNTKRNFIPFNEIDLVDSYGKEIMHQRVLMDIKNGVICMERVGKVNYVITLGTGFSQFQAFDFIQQYHNIIELIKRDLIKLVTKDANQFLQRETLNHLSIDAK